MLGWVKTTRVKMTILPILDAAGWTDRGAEDPDHKDREGEGRHEAGRPQGRDVSHQGDFKQDR